MTRCMSYLGVAMVMLSVTVLGGCKKSQAVNQAPPPPPMADAPPPPEDPSVYQTGSGYSQPAPAPQPTFVDAPAAGSPTMGGQTYVVQKGDTLMGIARKVYGSPARFRDIAAANGITDPNKIKVGQTLVIP